MSAADKDGAMDQAVSTPVMFEAVEFGSSLIPATVVEAVPRAVARLTPTVTCCDVGTTAVEVRTPNWIRRILKPTAAAATTLAKAVADAKAADDSATAENRAMLFTFL